MCVFLGGDYGKANKTTAIKSKKLFAETLFPMGMDFNEHSAFNLQIHFFICSARRLDNGLPELQAG
jgi:hypothetical protein